jgi:penicillin-binding protein 2
MAYASPNQKPQSDTGWNIQQQQRIHHRVWVMMAVLVLAFAGLFARLWFLQVVHGDDYLAQAEHNRLRKVPLPAPRGLILDRNGKVLATSIASHSIAIVPAALPSAKSESAKRDRLLKSLAFLLNITPQEIQAKLDDARERGANSYDPVRIALSVPLATIVHIDENKSRLGPAVLVTDDLQRSYPQGSLAAHVLGHVGLVTQDDLKRNQAAIAEDPETRRLGFDDKIGKNGIERYYDDLLRGTDGSALYEVDARSRPIRRMGEVAEKPGGTLQLSIDEKMQAAAEKALAASGHTGAAVAIDPRNGEVLVLASYPTYNPNIFSLPRRQFNAAYKKLADNTQHPFLDRALNSRFPPGSTFKLVTGAAVLQKGAVTPNTIFNCPGGLRVGERYFRCWAVHGNVNIVDALAHSCDVYFYNAALRLGDPESSGPTYLAQVARQFGLGTEMGIDLPGESAGLIPDPAWRKRINADRPDLAQWYPGNTVNMAIGQGDVLATPLQIASVTATVANGGTWWKPHLLKDVRDLNGKIIQTEKTQSHNVGIDPKNIEWVRRGMRATVTSGTGSVVDFPWLQVAGKTGSAEDVHHDLPHAWFACFAPYKNPQVAIAVIIENAGHGASNAAPVAKAILEAMFPDPGKKKSG